jgi:hypothetical protein
MDPRGERETREEEPARDPASPVAAAPVLLAQTRVRAAILMTAIARARRHSGGRQRDAVLVRHWLPQAVVNIDGRLSDPPWSSNRSSPEPWSEGI